MSKEINLGYLHIASWNPKKEKLFPDYYYDKNHELHEEEYFKQTQIYQPDDVVLPPDKEYTLIIDYPVKNPYKAKITTGKSGITRKKLAEVACKHYRKMYKEEDKSTKIKPGLIKGMFNRRETNGKFGIWGHVIEDLILHSAQIKGNNIELGVDS